jgi:hypothetical protein
MYKLFVQFQDGSKFDNTNVPETVVRGILKNGFKGVISYATVTTPSGVTRDVTSKLQMI